MSDTHYPILVCPKCGHIEIENVKSYMEYGYLNNFDSEGNEGCVTCDIYEDDNYEGVWKVDYLPCNNDVEFQEGITYKGMLQMSYWLAIDYPIITVASYYGITQALVSELVRVFNKTVFHKLNYQNYVNEVSPQSKSLSDVIGVEKAEEFYKKVGLN